MFAVRSLPDLTFLFPVGSDPRGFAVFSQTVTDEPFDYFTSEIASPGKRRCATCFNNSTERRTIMKVSEQTRIFLNGPLVSGFVPTVYALACLVSVPLNAMAAVTFCFCVRWKKPAAVYMSQLALADLLFGLLLPLKVHYYARGSNWVFGEAMCRVVTAGFYSYMYCSALLVMCISVDRLLAVAFPIASLRWRNPRLAAVVCAAVWLLALAGAIPLLTMQQTVPIIQVGITCHDMLHPNSKDSYLQLFSSLTCLYILLPVVVTIVCYVVVVRALRPKKALHGASKQSKKRKRAVMMALATTLEFVVCFAPTNVVLLVHCWQVTAQKAGAGDRSYAVYVLTLCLGSISIFLDPLLYYHGSSHFRQQVTRAKCWRSREKTAAYNTSNTNATSTESWCSYSRPCDTDMQIHMAQPQVAKIKLLE